MEIKDYDKMNTKTKKNSIKETIEYVKLMLGCPHCLIGIFWFAFLTGVIIFFGENILVKIISFIMVVVGFCGWMILPDVSW